MENFLDGHEFKSGQNFEDFFNFSYVPLQESQIPEARDLSNQLVNPQFQVLPQTVQTNPQAPIQQVIPPPKKEVKTESKQEETSSYKTSSSLNLPLMPKQDKDICLIDLPDDELIREIKDMYPTMSQKNMNELLRKRKEISQVLHGSTSELHAVIQNYQTKFLQLLHEEEQNRRVSEQEKQEKIAKFNEKITFYQVEMKKACEAVFRQLVIKLGKRRNRSLPPEATAVLKEWFLDHYKHPYPTEAEKKELQNKTQLTTTQINNWFINKRVRIWRPLISKMQNEQRSKNRKANLAQLKKAL